MSLTAAEGILPQSARPPHQIPRHEPAPAATHRVDGLELGFLAVALAIGTAVWTALVLAELGLFLGSIGALGSLAFGSTVGWGIWSATARRRGVERPARLDLAIIAVVVVAAAVVLGRPHEYVFGGLDPGVYLNTAAHVARSGGLLWSDGMVAALPEPARDALFRELPTALVEGSRLVGFYFVDVESGLVVPHGMHLFPSALAIGYALGGVPGALFVPPILAATAIIAVALLARRLAGPGPIRRSAAAGLAAGLLLANPAETWFGRYPAAETSVQASLFVGLLALAVGLEHRAGWLAAAGGLMLGLVHLAKVETFVLLVAVGAVFGWLWLTGRLQRTHVAFLAGYGAMLAHLAGHVAGISTFYTVEIYRRSLGPTVVLLLAVALALVVGLVVLALARPRLVRAAAGRVERERGWLWLALVAVVALLGVYAWYFRPLDLSGEVAAAPDALKAVVRNRLHALPRLGWYLPPLAILLAALGYVVAVRRAGSAATALFVAVLGFEAVLVLSDPRITPEYPWAARRWIGTLIPGAVLVMATLLAAMVPPRLPRRWRWAPGFVGPALLPVALALPVFATSLGASAPLLSHREYAGSTALVERIAAAMPADAVVLLDDDLIGWRLSAPLQFLTGHPAFVLFGEAGRDERAALALDDWRDRGRPVYWLRSGEAMPFERFGRRWTARDQWRIGLREARSTTDVIPTATRPFDGLVTLYAPDTP